MYYTELEELANQIEKLKMIANSTLILLIINMIITAGLLFILSNNNKKD